MLGSRSDVEDIVQEAYLRYATAAAPEIGSLKAYLMTIVTRLCLDQRKSARFQREQPLGLRWSLVPEDIEETALRGLDQHEAISQALLLLLECLTPDERAVFLLHDVFAYPYEEIARIVGKQPATCRQLAHRAQARLIERRPRFVPAQQAHHRLLDRFLAASQQGELQALLDALVKDMTEKAGHKRKESMTDASSRTRRKKESEEDRCRRSLAARKAVRHPPGRTSAALDGVSNHQSSHRRVFGRSLISQAWYHS